MTGSSTEFFPPVETEFAEYVRLVGLERVSERLLELRDRARRRELTIVERGEADVAVRVLDTLKGMAPIGALQPARAKGPLQLPPAL